MTSITQILPVELISAIIGSLADIDENQARKSNLNIVPFSNLRACSLTCRAFLPLSRKHIFRSIGLTRYCDAEQSSKELFSQAESLLTLLTQTPEIGRYVQDLQLTLWYPELIPEANDYTSLSFALEKLSGLRTIDFWCPGTVDLDWKTMPAHLRVSLLQCMRLPTVTSLAFCGITNFTLSSLIYCTALKTLDFDCVDLVPGEPETDVVAQVSLSAPSVQLTRIVLNRQDIGTILPRLLGQKRDDGNRIFSFERFDAFKVNFPQTMQDAQTVATFLLNVPSVKDLSLKFIDSVSAGPALAAMLHCANALKSLSLEINMNTQFVLFSGICNALEAIAPKSRLEVLTLKISALASQSIQDGEWKELEKALLVPGWSCLREVDLLIHTFPENTLNQTLGLPRKQLQRLATSKSFEFRITVRQI